MDLTQPQLLIEIILSILLCAGILYSFYITRVLSSLKRDKETLGNLLKSLQESINTAETGMEQLRITSEMSGKPLNRLIERGKEVQEILNSSITRASQVNNKIEIAIEKTPLHINEITTLIKRAQAIQNELKESLKQRENTLLQKNERQQKLIQKKQQDLKRQELERLKKIEMEREALEEDKVNLQKTRLSEEKQWRKAASQDEESLFTDTVTLPSSERLTQDRPYLKALRGGKSS